MNRLTSFLASTLLLVSNLPSVAQTDSDILLMIPPLIASANSCEGVGEWEGTEGLINAVDFSRSTGANKGQLQGVPIIRFNDGSAVTTRAEYDICVPEDGRYNVRIHTYTSGHTNNGMFIGVNGKLQAALPDHPLAGFRDIYLRKYIWSWNPEWLGSGNRHSGPVDILLEKGPQTLSIHKRKIERPFIHQIRLIKR